MISQIMAAWRGSDFDFRVYAHPDDPLEHLFPEWVDYYRLKWAIAKVIQPRSIIEIGVRYGYSALAFLDAAPTAKFVGIDVDSTEFGGEVGAIEWAKDRLAPYEASIILGDSQTMSTFPGDRYDLIHVGGHQDGDGTYRDLQKAIKQASYILVDGFLWSHENTQASTAFVKDHRRMLEFCVVIPGYAGELLIKVDEEKRTDLGRGYADSLAVKGHYGDDYYLTDCGGFREFHTHGGRVLADPRLETVFSVAAIGQGMHVVDAGCGRGELSYASAAAGATVDAVDYSESAIALAESCFVDDPALSERVRFHCSSITEFDFSGGAGHGKRADRVIASDLIEHLSPTELDQFYANAAAGLSDDGQLVIHTYPNAWYYRYGYAARRKVLRRLGGYISPEPRTFYEQLMHINEQSPRALRDQLSGCFPHVLVWFGNPENPLDSLLRPYGKTDYMNAPSLYAIGSHVEIDVDGLRHQWMQEPLSRESMRQVSLELTGSSPDSGRLGGLVAVTVTVTNRTQDAIRSHAPNPVYLAYHWVDANGALVVFDGIRTTLPHVGANEQRTVEMVIDKPRHDGPLTLQIGLVQEGVDWFESASDTHLLELPG